MLDDEPQAEGVHLLVDVQLVASVLLLLTYLLAPGLQDAFQPQGLHVRPKGGLHHLLFLRNL